MISSIVSDAALLSFRCIADRSSAVLNRVMRLVGVEYLALAFLRDLPGMLSKGGTLKLLLYVPFIALAMVGMLLSVGLWASRGLTATGKIDRSGVLPSKNWTSTEAVYAVRLNIASNSLGSR